MSVPQLHGPHLRNRNHNVGFETEGKFGAEPEILQNSVYKKIIKIG